VSVPKTQDRSAALLLVVGLTLYFSAYTGIRHDATLYLGQGLLTAFPHEFSADLFFRFGSQASFTIFPQLIAWLITRFTPGDVFLWGTLAGRLFFVTGAWLIARAVLPRGYRLYALLAVVVLPAGYGALNIFHYGEAFLTARPFAEALVLVSIASLVRKHYMASGCALALAFVLHPLQAFAGTVVLWIWLALEDRRWLHLAWIGVLVLAGALLDIEPLQKMLEQLDGKWLASVREINGHCLMLEWPARDWLRWLTDLYLLYCLASLRLALLSRLSLACIMAMALGAVFTLVAGDLLHLALPVGLQAWRTQWVGHLVAMAGVPVMLAHHWRDANRLHRRTAVVLFIAIVTIGAPMGISSPPWANALLIPLHFFWPKLREHISSRYRHLLYWAVSAALALNLARFVFSQFKIFSDLAFRNDLFRLDTVLLAHPLFVGAVLVVLLAIWARLKGYGRAAGVVSLALFALWSCARWDFRSPWTRQLEAARFDSKIFGPAIESGADVYWFEQLLPTWLVLKRASYYNRGQQAGQMFNRGTALEADHRRTRMAPVELQAAICSMMGRVDDEAGCFISRLGLEQACRTGGATHPPDYLVLPFHQPEPAIGEWVIPDRIGGEAAAHYYLYRCRDLMAGSKPQGSLS